MAFPHTHDMSHQSHTQTWIIDANANDICPVLFVYFLWTGQLFAVQYIRYSRFSPFAFCKDTRGTDDEDIKWKRKMEMMRLSPLADYWMWNVHAASTVHLRYYYLQGIFEPVFSIVVPWDALFASVAIVMPEAFRMQLTNRKLPLTHASTKQFTFKAKTDWMDFVSDVLLCYAVTVANEFIFVHWYGDNVDARQKKFVPFSVELQLNERKYTKWHCENVKLATRNWPMRPQQKKHCLHSRTLWYRLQVSGAVKFRLCTVAADHCRIRTKK